MGELKAMDDVVFDFRVAQDLADRCRAVAGRLEQIWRVPCFWVRGVLGSLFIDAVPHFVGHCLEGEA